MTDAIAREAGLASDVGEGETLEVKGKSEPLTVRVLSASFADRGTP